MIVADTSGLLAYFNRREPAHDAAVEVISKERDPLVVSPFVLAELDYLVSTRIGVDAELAALAELASGAYQLAAFSDEDVRAAREVVDRYRDQSIGLTDASLVVLAKRHSTRRLLTLDHRHFETVRPLDGGRFHLLP